MLALTSLAVADPAHPAAGPGRIAVDFRAALQPIDAHVTDETRSLAPADAVTTRSAHPTAKLAPRAPTPLVLH
ncbi:hypothetical protein ACIQJ4_07625 [Streptomyces filamentosus]|uniref:hypothetical protein n=1 Tax=Streptomyces filamentosus TaxID=67294 RepID=UPI003815C6A4